ncbi:hypothetical protein FJZ41_01515 [Candidatus Shapirobacteria bacterium]|nr:hypothetical protein [Candidatus Shapirobacteria bacterium]
MIILHGDNNELSRQRLRQEIERFKQKGKGEFLRFEAGELRLLELKQALASPTLMGQNQLVLVENLFGSRRTKEKEKIIDDLKKSLPRNLIIWEAKKIDGRFLTAFKNQILLRFDLPAVVFKFLDSLAPKSAQNSLPLLHQSLTQNSPEMVFYLLARQIRLLILAVDLGKTGLASMEPWRQEKLIRQGQKFGLKELLRIYRDLLRIDTQQKTGQSPFPLVSQLDLLIASL